MCCNADVIWLLLNVQNKNSEFCAPLTSFDWNETDPKRLGTSSIDTTCTIWDIEVSKLDETYCSNCSTVRLLQT